MILSMFTKHSWLRLIDLKDAYSHIDIHKQSQQYLQFAIGHQAFQSSSFAIGLSTATRTFTKCVAVVCMFLCQLKIQVYRQLVDSGEFPTKNKMVILQTIQCLSHNMVFFT